MVHPGGRTKGVAEYKPTGAFASRASDSQAGGSGRASAPKTAISGGKRRAIPSTSAMLAWCVFSAVQTGLSSACMANSVAAYGPKPRTLAGSPTRAVFAWRGRRPGLAERIGRRPNNAGNIRRPGLISPCSSLRYIVRRFGMKPILALLSLLAALGYAQQPTNPSQNPPAPPPTAVPESSQPTPTPQPRQDKASANNQIKDNVRSAVDGDPILSGTSVQV